MIKHKETNTNGAAQSASLITRRNLAERWQVSTETLKRRERAGRLPYLKIGRGVRYRISDVEKLEAAFIVGGAH